MEFLGRREEKGKHFFLHHGRWWLVPFDGRTEGGLYSVPFEIFGAGIFKRMLTQQVMSVEEEDLSEKLPDLYAGLKAKGIELILDNQPVRTAQWEFELDASRASIDWFEIRPEIRCNGITIAETLWEKALTGRGMIEHDGTIQILDPASLKTLSAIFTRLKLDISDFFMALEGRRIYAPLRAKRRKEVLYRTLFQSWLKRQEGKSRGHQGFN